LLLSGIFMLQGTCPGSDGVEVINADKNVKNSRAGDSIAGNFFTNWRGGEAGGIYIGSNSH
jgi:hypothetical protein